jgi:hypothetical protein
MKIVLKFKPLNFAAMSLHLKNVVESCLHLLPNLISSDSRQDHRSLKARILKLKKWGKCFRHERPTSYPMKIEFYRPNFPWHSILYLCCILGCLYLGHVFSKIIFCYPWFNSSSRFQISTGRKKLKEALLQSTLLKLFKHS